MTDLILNDDLKIDVEHHKKQVHLIVFEAGVENVCRKESLKNLSRFIHSDEAHLFKERLQLHKSTAGIATIVKGKSVGNINTEEFINCLEKVNERD
ncbi:MAG: hypothetical protein JWP44_710 [Mucilaginibacter sp.]|nr:hypothetical protein [Mucilaginibacter sp.]